MKPPRWMQRWVFRHLNQQVADFTAALHPVGDAVMIHYFQDTMVILRQRVMWRATFMQRLKMKLRRKPKREPMLIGDLFKNR